MPEINNPTRTRHWVAFSGEVVRTGVTEPGEITTSGLPNLEQFDSDDQALESIKNKIHLLEPLKDVEGDELSVGVYRHKGKVVRVVDAHTRGREPVANGPKFRVAR